MSHKIMDFLMAREETVIAVWAVITTVFLGSAAWAAPAFASGDNAEVAVLAASGSSIIVNGVVVKGRSVVISRDGGVFVDGAKLKGNDAIDVRSSCDVAVQGNAESVYTSSGNVKVTGKSGSIVTASGDVRAGTVSGDVSTASGNIHAGEVHGNVTTVSGSITHRGDNN